MVKYKFGAQDSGLELGPLRGSVNTQYQMIWATDKMLFSAIP